MELYDFANRMCNLRQATGRTQAEAGDALGVTRTAIYNWECGRNFPVFDKAVAICELYDVSLDWLAYGEREAAQ